MSANATFRPEMFDISARARRAVVEAGFEPAFSDAVEAEIAALGSKAEARDQLADLRLLLWSSVDNAESRDLDQIEWAERLEAGTIRLLVGIADVAEFVPQGGPTDARARRNTTSVYTGVETFHLLPEALSTNRTSLLSGQDRIALVIELSVDPTGAVLSPRVFRALVRNHARLTYDEVGEFLANPRQLSPALADRPDLWGQLNLQREVSNRLIALRKQQGALTYSNYEPRPVKSNGKLELRCEPHDLAREMIESFMVATNIATAAFLKSRGFPILERIIAAPRRWDRIRTIASWRGTRLPEEPDRKALSTFLAHERARDPAGFEELSLAIIKMLGPGEYAVEYPEGPQQGHFGLAVDDYSHSTAPNRRFADLVLQRLLHAALAQKSLTYSREQLFEIAQRCTERSRMARKVERLVRKIAAALQIYDHIGDVFDGLVTGASRKGTYVRLFKLPVEGKIVRGERGMDVGDEVRVRLIRVDPENGFIDFERA